MSDNGVVPSGQPHRPVFRDDVSTDSAIVGYVDPLDVPAPAAGPLLAIKRFYTLYATFHGRASRREFWWVALYLTLSFTILSTLATVVGATTRRYVDGTLETSVGVSPFWFIAGALALASIVPWIALGVRRLHDTNLSGLVWLVSLVPVLGTLALLVVCLRATDPAGARFDRIRPAYPSDFHPDDFIPPAAVGPSAASRLQQTFGPM